MDKITTEFPTTDHVVGGFSKYTSLSLLITLVAVLVGHFYIKTKVTRKARLVNKFGGKTILPFIGNVTLFAGDPKQLQKRITEYMRTFGKTCRVWKFDQARIFTCEAQVIEKVLSSSSLIEKGSDYFAIKYYLGNGLVTSNGAQWRKDRKMISPGFSSKHFNGFLGIFNRQAATLTAILSQEFKNDFAPRNIYPFLARYSIDTILEAATGNHENIQYKPDQTYAHVVPTINSAITELMFKPWLSLPIIRDLFGKEKATRKCLKFVRKTLLEIAEWRKSLMHQQIDDEERLKPYLDIILQSDIARSDDSVVEHVLGIVAAATDTITTVANFTLFLLALNPRWQNRVYQEINEIFKKDKQPRDVNSEELHELKTLEMCIKESLRLYPPGPNIARRIDHDVKLDSGLVLPEGCDVIISIFDLHRNPDVFPDPEIFNPERFTKEESSKRGPYDFIPFSAGPRNCIGRNHSIKQVIVLLVHVLRTFEVSTNQKKEDIAIVFGNSLGCSPDIELALKSRQPIC